MKNIVLIALLILFFLSGCGGGEQGSSNPVLGGTEIIDRYESTAIFILSKNAGGTSSGTGIVLDNRGTILTNHHVISRSTSLEVRSPVTDDMIPARIVGRAPCDDLAVIQVTDSASDFTPAVIGDSGILSVGMDVYAVGFPGTIDQNFYDTEMSITRGVVSRLNAKYEPWGLRNLLQIDAAINPGNSGGPLVDDRGRVVGVNTLKSAVQDDVNYAISIENAKSVYEQLLGGDDLNWIGMSVTDSILQNVATLKITYIESGSDIANDDSDWRVGEFIDSIDGREIYNLGDMCDILRSKSSGDQLELKGLYYNPNGVLRAQYATVTIP